MSAKPQKLIIKAELHIATGHQAWAQGCGAHRDRRYRRQGTKNQKLKAALRE